MASSVTFAKANLRAPIPEAQMAFLLEALHRQNHWFDALYNACAAGHGCGVRLVQEQVAQQPEQQQRRRTEHPDGTPWIDPNEVLGWMRERRW
jgi:hypothetical protein